jgi:hypothetical protein
MKRVRTYTDDFLSFTPPDLKRALLTARQFPAYNGSGWQGYHPVAGNKITARRWGVSQVRLWGALPDGVSHEAPLTIEVRPGRFGGHFLRMRCPLCQNLRQRLYLRPIAPPPGGFYFGRFGCRQCLELTYRSQSLTPKKRRQRLAARYPDGKPWAMHRSTWAKIEKRLKVNPLQVGATQ